MIPETTFNTFFYSATTKTVLKQGPVLMRNRRKGSSVHTLVQRRKHSKMGPLLVLSL